MGLTGTKQTDNANTRSTANSWLAVLGFAAVIFALLYWVAPWLLTAGWWYRIYLNDPDKPPLVLISVLILVLAIALAAVIAHGFGRGPRRMERKALMLGSWVIYLPAFVGGLVAIGGLSYLMLFPFLAGGVVSLLAYLLIQRNAAASPYWLNWIAIGRVGHGAVDRPDNGDWRVAPLLLVAIGLAITILGLVQVFRAHREKRLQRDGLYATVRHPQHLGIAIWTFGLALAASTTAAYMTWFTMLYCYILLALWEEKHLAQQFGSSYGDYRQSTPFMIPFVNIGLPLPQSRWRMVAALAGCYLAGMAILCLIIQTIGVDTNWYL
jgi:uncharacterized membrane protein